MLASPLKCKLVNVTTKTTLRNLSITSPNLEVEKCCLVSVP